VTLYQSTTNWSLKTTDINFLNSGGQKSEIKSWQVHAPSEALGKDPLPHSASGGPRHALICVSLTLTPVFASIFS
jgi:hypothetical protein